MHKIVRLMSGGLVVAVSMLICQNDAQAQYPIAIQPVAPAVVGYAPQRRGLFGQRTVYRPVVAPVAAVSPVVTGYASPVVAAYAPPVAPVAAYYPPPVAPVAAYYAPPVAPVAAYYAPPAPVAVPVRAYRVPVRAYYPVYGF